MENSDWNPDLRFIEFLRAGLEKEGEDGDKPFVAVGPEVFTVNDWVNAMVVGTVMGRRTYLALFASKTLQEEYQRYLEEYQRYLAYLESQVKGQ